VLSYATDPEEVLQCAGSLHFATPPIAKSIRKYLDTHDHRIGVVCKSCDARAIIELSKINQVNIENILMIGINCSGTLSPVPHIELLRKSGVDPYELEWENIEERDLVLRFKGEGEKRFRLEELEQEELGIRANCRRCEYPVPRMADLACGKWGLEDGEGKSLVEICSNRGKSLLEKAARSGILELSHTTKQQIERRSRKEKEKTDAAKAKQAAEFSAPDEKFYWFLQFENCIKCYGCRDACPLCHCKRCVLERDVPEMVEKGTLPPPITFGMIRMFHVACSCVNCGQCEDACSADIPVSRLAHNLNKISSRLFGYDSGIDVDAPLPLCAIPEEEKKLTSAEL
jgi:formate dehydrogenase subunit beta